jgi:lipopolysaccharide export system permease protein
MPLTAFRPLLKHARTLRVSSPRPRRNNFVTAVPGVGNEMFVSSSPPPRWRLPILDTYILREMIPPFTFAFATFLLFWFVNIFFLAADFVVNKGAPFFVVLRFLIFRVPQATPMAFPFACLFATLMAFGRLMADNEINALRTSGVPFLRIVRLPVIAGLVAFAASYLMNERIVPYATDMSTRTFYQMVYKAQSLPIEPNLFRQDSTTGMTFYVGSVDADHKTMHTIQIFKRGRNVPYQEVTAAETGYLDGAVLVLKNAQVVRFKPDGSFDQETHPKEVSIGLPLGESAENFLSTAYNDPFTMDSKHLADDIKFRKQTGQGGTELANREITLAQKLAYPFASFIAVMIALPLAVRFGKKGRALGIALSIVMMFCYWAVGAMTAAFAHNGILNPYFAAWIPNILMAAGAGALILLEDR